MSKRGYTMCGYYIPPEVRAEATRYLQRGITDPVTIAGALHEYEFAVEIVHRLNIIEEIKQDYYRDNPDKLYSFSDEPLSDTQLSDAIAHTPDGSTS